MVYGDTRSDHEAHKKVVAAIMKKKPATVFHTGDLVAVGRIGKQWRIFNKITGKMRDTAEYYPALGNHEMNSRKYYRQFDLPNNEQWYTVDKQGVHFIVLNTCTNIQYGSEQYKWLENDLQNIDSTVNFVVAIFHHSPYSTGRHVEDEKGLRNSITPLFEKYQIDAVFTGHDHHYERSEVNGTCYIVSGGGGAPLYGQSRKSEYSKIFKSLNHFCVLNVIDNKLVIEALDPGLKSIDKIEIPSKR